MQPNEPEDRSLPLISTTPAEEQSYEEPIPQSSALVIFGATGDLTRRKLIPALFHLFQSWQLPDHWYVLGVGRGELSDEVFREMVKKSVVEAKSNSHVPAAVLETFYKRFYYSPLNNYEAQEGYDLLVEKLATLDKKYPTDGNRIFYLATPPSLYSKIAQQLGRSGLNKQKGKKTGATKAKKTSPSTSNGAVRVVVEKPFGMNLSSAQSLNHEMREVFGEEQLYRIDHYLGKEAVQNMLFLRFANAIFEPIWNRRFIDHIQITAAETLGIESRAGYYEGSGALRDMFQNHLLQMLCLVAMEAPTSFEADRIRDEKVKVLRSVRPFDPATIDDFAVRGQYGEGLLEGVPVGEYRKEPRVNPKSKTETFAALKLFIDNWRWQGVPFYLRSGKRLAAKSTEIVIVFKQVPHLLFRPLFAGEIASNTLVLSLQPSEGISLTFQAKYPGPKFSMGKVTMDFNYHGSFQISSPDAYERLLLDCLAGDQMLFSRGDWVELSWKLLMPVIRHWEKNKTPHFPNYPSGSFGPKEADDLLQRDGRSWRSPSS